MGGKVTCQCPRQHNPHHTLIVLPTSSGPGMLEIFQTLPGEVCFLVMSDSLSEHGSLEFITSAMAMATFTFFIIILSQLFWSMYVADYIL